MTSSTRTPDAPASWTAPNIIHTNTLRYHNSINDAVADLGQDIGEAFTGFQKHLYQGVA